MKVGKSLQRAQFERGLVIDLPFAPIAPSERKAGAGGAGRPRRYASILLPAFLSAIVSACGEEETIAPYRMSPDREGISQGDEPITTQVYRYQGPGKELYSAIGKPIRFRFPEHAYTLEQNWRGGTQLTIAVEYDQRTTRPIVEAIERENPGLAGIEKISELRDRAYGDRSLRILISALNDYRFPEPASGVKALADRISDENVKPVTDYCGVDWYSFDDEEPAGRSPPIPNDPAFDQLTGVDIRAIAGGGGKRYVLSCDAFDPKCSIEFGFRDMPAAAIVARDKICAHARLKRMATNILERQVIGK